jgi:hypothetical protein
MSHDMLAAAPQARQRAKAAIALACAILDA